MSAWILTVMCQPAADKAGRPAGSDIPVSEPAAGWPARVRFGGGGGANVTQSKRWEENTVCSLGKYEYSFFKAVRGEWGPFWQSGAFFLFCFLCRRREKKEANVPMQNVGVLTRIVERTFAVERWQSFSGALWDSQISASVWLERKYGQL